jgi:hypothetical protein
MIPTDCWKAYYRGIKDSGQHPMASGVYKIRERHEQAMMAHETVEKIIVSLQRRKCPWTYGMCTPESKAQWLRHILPILGYELGRDVIPAFDALTGDGMEKSLIEMSRTQVKRRCDAAASDLDSAMTILKGPIRHEYWRMKHHGVSAVEFGIVAFLKALEDIVAMTPPSIQQSVFRFQQQATAQ